jgi:hypothetical protein
MLRRSKGWFSRESSGLLRRRTRYHFNTLEHGQGRFVRSFSEEEYVGMLQEQREHPISIAAQGHRKWWWFRDEVLLGTANMNSFEVEGMILEREARTRPHHAVARTGPASGSDLLLGGPPEAFFGRLELRDPANQGHG